MFFFPVILILYINMVFEVCKLLDYQLFINRIVIY